MLILFMQLVVLFWDGISFVKNLFKMIHRAVKHFLHWIIRISKNSSHRFFWYIVGRSFSGKSSWYIDRFPFQLMSARRLVPDCTLLDHISFGVLCTVIGFNSLAIHLFISEGMGLNFVLGLVLPKVFLEVAHVNCFGFNMKSKITEQ